MPNDVNDWLGKDIINCLECKYYEIKHRDCVYNVLKKGIRLRITNHYLMSKKCPMTPDEKKRYNHR